MDEVDDSRTTLEYCIRELMNHHPAEIAVTVSTTRISTSEAPFLGSLPLYRREELGDVWIVYPWDARDIDEHDRNAAKV